mgnify:CR=1 FL=1
MELKQQRLIMIIWPEVSFNRTLWNWNEGGWTVPQKYYGAFNRTLWNWNTSGISGGNKYDLAFNRTLWNWNCVISHCLFICKLLLIVPYGIETYIASHWRNRYRLLIVPYGIETLMWMIHSSSVPTFNRTLWNWNKRTVVLSSVLFHF